MLHEKIQESTLDTLIPNILDLYFTELEILNDRVYNAEDEFAVCYSPGFGAGWHTWNTGLALCFSPEAVILSLWLDKLTPSGKKEFKSFVERLINTHEYEYGNVWENLIYQLVKVKTGKEIYPGGFDEGLTVEWISPGTNFQIREYDGSEAIEYADQTDWLC